MKIRFIIISTAYYSKYIIVCRIFTVFGLIRGQSVIQESMGRDPPSYPPRVPELVPSLGSYEKSEF